MVLAASLLAVACGSVGAPLSSAGGARHSRSLSPRASPADAAKAAAAAVSWVRPSTRRTRRCEKTKTRPYKATRR